MTSLPLPTVLLPVLPDPRDPLDPTQPKRNAATAATAASARALSAQAIAFYFRAPAKAFFRMRVDYLAFARSLHAAEARALSSALASARQASELPVGTPARALLRTWHRMRVWAHGTTPGVLASAVRQQGWGIIPQQVLPPLVANVGVGAVLYTSYLQILGTLHEESGRGSKRVYPPPRPVHTFEAGFLAGAIQSVVAAPLDAIQARYDHRDLMRGGDGRPMSMWVFSVQKIREIGLRGIFAGWGLSFAKDSLGSAVFFSTFEYIKAQGYYRFVSWFYGGLEDSIIDDLALKRPANVGSLYGATSDATAGIRAGVPISENGLRVIRPHYSIEPAFLLVAGTCASFAQQVVIHPLTYVQLLHWDRLERLDVRATEIRGIRDGGRGTRGSRGGLMMKASWEAYRETWRQCMEQASKEGRGVVGWLFRGFWWNTIRQVPSTSAGLIIFELVRRKYGINSDEVRIQHEDYEILVN